MSKNSQKALEQLVPFLVLGVAIALGIGLLIMFSYVVIWGIIIGGIIWLVVFIKNYFSPKSNNPESSGRIIEHEDKDKD